MLPAPPPAILLDFFLTDFKLMENTQFWSGHSWMTVLIVAWLAPRAVMPGRVLRWLTVFCTLRQLIVAREYLQSSIANSPFDLLEPTAWISRLTGIACAWVLWELAGTLGENRPMSPRLRWLGRTGWTGLFALGVAGGLDGAGTIEALVFAPASLLIAFAFWQQAPPVERPGIRLVAVGFGLIGCATTAATFAAAFGSAAVPVLLYLVHFSGWVVVAGIGWAVLLHYRTFSRLAFGIFLVLATLPLWVVLTFGVMLPPTEKRTQRDLLDWAEGLTAAVPRDAVARLVNGAAGAGDRATVEDPLRRALASSSFVRRLYVWQPEKGRRRVFAGLASGRPWTIRDDRPAYWYQAPATTAFAARQRFFEPPYEAHDGELVDLTLPLRETADGPVVAWVTLEVNSRPYWRGLNGLIVPLIVFFDCFTPYLNAVCILAWRRATEQRRIEQLIKVQQADRAKTEFLAFLGHELRTPLQTILGRAELLRREPAAARHAASIDAQGRLLLRLVNDLLDLGTIEAGHFALHLQSFSLRASLAHLDDLVRPLAQAKGLALHMELADGVPDGLVSDEPRLRQILGNLLTNAVKYTPRGEVRLEIASAPRSSPGLVFRVRDTGPGLPAGKIPELFTLFTRLDAGDTFSREGTGVGLALVKRLCDLMGGNVTAGNRPAGGAEFTVWLPFAPAALVPPAPAAAASPALAPASVLKVLIAEDNTAARDLLAEALRQLGHEVVTAADGSTALAACARQRFDSVVLDVNLPGVDGIEIARRLRAQPDCPRLIGCSAEVLPATRQAALEAGMDDFFGKPVELATLAAALAIPAETAPAASPDTFASVRSVLSSGRLHQTIRGELPEIRRQLAAALAARDAAALRRHAHYLHTSALLLAADDLASLCTQLGRDAAGDDFSGAAETNVRLNLALDRLEA